MHTKKEYIAVFDSGLGGISVLRELVRRMPGERYLYYGDSANAPYGSRSTQQVRQLTMQAAEKLMYQGVKALVVACNTATAVAIEDLRRAYPDTIVVGIEPAVKVAADLCTGGHIGVMATPVTLREEKFHQLLERFPDIQICPIQTPELAELIETGASRDQIREYLTPILSPLAGSLDAVVLGCTHYPFAADVIGQLLGEKTRLVDGGAGTAQHTMHRLEEAGLLWNGPGEIRMENSTGDAALLARCMALLGE